MKTIKKYWAVIVGAILALIAVIFTSDKINKKKVTKSDIKIDDNKAIIEIIYNVILLFTNLLNIALLVLFFIVYIILEKNKFYKTS